MNRFSLFALLALLMFPVLGFAQQMADSLDCDTCVQRLHAQCPIKKGEGWTVVSVAAVGDTVAVEIETPASLNAFMATLTQNIVNTKRLWVRYVSDYGKDWKDLFNCVQEERRLLLLLLTPKDSDNTYRLLVEPDELGTILAKN